MSAFPTPVSSPALDLSTGGVFEVDPKHLPEMPADAVAAIVRDHAGRIRTLVVTVPEDAGDEFRERMWQWFELVSQRPNIRPASGRPHLQIVRPA